MRSKTLPAFQSLSSLEISSRVYWKFIDPESSSTNSKLGLTEMLEDVCSGESGNATVWVCAVGVNTAERAIARILARKRKVRMMYYLSAA